MAAPGQAEPPVNPAVAAILDAHEPPAAAGRPVKTRGQAMTKEAIRSRDRRAKAKQATQPAPQAEPPRPAPIDPPAEAPDDPADRFTPAHLQLLPDGPSRSTGPTPEKMEKAIRNWTMIFSGAGFIAAKIIWKSDTLKVPETDARDCAEALLDAWPELADDVDGDWKKIMALVVIGSVGKQRWEAYQATKRPDAPQPPAVATPPRDETNAPASAPSRQPVTLLP